MGLLCNRSQGRKAVAEAKQERKTPPIGNGRGPPQTWGCAAEDGTAAIYLIRAELLSG